MIIDIAAPGDKAIHGRERKEGGNTKISQEEAFGCGGGRRGRGGGCWWCFGRDREAGHADGTFGDHDEMGVTEEGSPIGGGKETEGRILDVCVTSPEGELDRGRSVSVYKKE